MKKRNAGVSRWGILLFILIGLGYFPEVVGPGIDAPQQIGPYLNGAFPNQAPSTLATDVDYTIENAFPFLTFIDPLDMVELPNSQLMVIGKSGYVWVFENDPGVINKTEVLDITTHTISVGDSGLLGLALHPDFANNGYFYLWYRYTPDADSEDETGYMRLERFTLQYDGSGQPFVDTGTPHVLIQQFDTHRYHNGGGMFFGPDGFLYLVIGDEGGVDDEFNTTQRLDQWLFSGILRIDVDEQGGSVSHPIQRQPMNPSTPPDGWPDSYTQNYYIPNDNPWSGSNGAYLEEFFSIGTRSPHRMTYDPIEDEIWIGDVGQARREEINVIDRARVLSESNGANMQWPYREGDIDGPKAKPNPLIGYDNPPIFAYPRSFGNCVIGGLVIRYSTLYPELEGKYLFSDHAVQNVWTLEKDPAGGAPDVQFLLNVPFEGQGERSGISSFAQTSDGTVYILDLFGTNLDGGKIRKLVRGEQESVPEPPEQLSELPAFTDLSTLSPAAGLIPYGVNTPLWSDRAFKQRWIAIPNDGTHNTPAEQILFDKEDNWQFPPGTVVVKHFELPLDERNSSLTTRLETRFLIFDKHGGAYGVTYQWNEAGTDAFLLRDGATRDIVVTKLDGSTFTQTWEFPNRQQCMSCHNNLVNFGLGLKTRQINMDFTYPNGIVANQLETWNHLGVFNQDIGDPKVYPQNADLGDSSADAGFRIRSYFDANCSFCHRPNGVVGAFDARGLTALHDQRLINVEVVSSSSPAGGLVIKPGSSAESVLWQRDNSVAETAMPPIAKNVIDEEYIELLTSWIDSLDSNAPANIDEGWYLLAARHSELFLGAKNGFTYNNADVVQQQNEDLEHQRWYAQNVGGNKYIFVNQASDLCLAIENMRSGEGISITQQEWMGMQNQLWYIESVPGDFYQIKSAYNGLNIGISGAATTAGTAARTVLPDAGDNAQQFALISLSGDPIVFNPVDCPVDEYASETLPQCRYSLKFADSSEPDGTPERAFDQIPSTLWHTEWRLADPPHPHEIQLELETSFLVSGLRYLPRQDGIVDGTIADFEIYLSEDGANWGSLVTSGTWANNADWKEVDFSPQKARFVRLVALSEVDGNPWTSAAEIEIVASVCLKDQEILGEKGVATVDHNWTLITLDSTYADPVVIAGSVGFEDPEGVTTRIRNVTANSFEIRLEEWTCSDGSHLQEAVSYVVLEAGIHKLMNGTTLIAGNADAVDHQWEVISYPKPFITPPVIFTQCTSVNDNSPIVTRIDHTQTNQSQFAVKLQEGEIDPDAPHEIETISWIALEPSTQNGHFSFESAATPVDYNNLQASITFNQCYANPVFISRVSSYYGSDPTGMRYVDLTNGSVNVFVEEDACSDEEIGHVDESIHYWVFNGPGPIYGRTMSLINARIYLQGSWDGTAMRTALKDAGLLPLMHPYSEAPWNYHGNECVSAIPPDAVDWVLVELRHEEDSEKIIAQRACFLRKDGMLMDLDGTTGVFFNRVPLKNGYLSIRHRNHLGVMTQSIVSLR